MSLIELIERVEKASAPDRNIDAEIAPLQGLRIVDEGHPIGRMCYDDIGCAHLLPRYTASLDAAMTLVPPGCTWRLTYLASRHGQGEVGSATVISPPASGQQHGGDAATPALALVAAALRARAQQTGERQ